MELNDFFIDAVDRVLSWDLPDESIRYAVSAEAGLLARLDSEQIDEPG